MLFILSPFSVCFLCFVFVRFRQEVAEISARSCRDFLSYCFIYSFLGKKLPSYFHICLFSGEIEVGDHLTINIIFMVRFLFAFHCFLMACFLLTICSFKWLKAGFYRIIISEHCTQKCYLKTIKYRLK